jgi:hypothetical protein
MLVTKGQLECLFKGWDCEEPIPKKGKRVFICFPCKVGFEDDLAEVEWTDLRSTYNERLYRITQSSKAGRLIEETIQEGHVIAFKRVRHEETRLNNLARNKALSEQMNQQIADQGYSLLSVPVGF